MRSVCLLIAAMLGISSTYAQHSSISLPKHRRAVSGLLGAQHSRSAMRTTTTTQRVIAISTRDNTLGSLNDSVNLKYTGTARYSVYDYNDMLFPYNYPYAASPMFDYAGVFTKPQVLFDTMRHWQVNPNTLVYGYYETAYATYDGSNNTTGYLNLFADSTLYSHMNQLYTNTFDAYGNISRANTYNWHSGIADSALRQFFTYNSANKLTKDSTYVYHLGTWRLASKSMYTYDASNNLIQVDNYSNMMDSSYTAALTEQLQYVNTYDASNRLLTVLTSMRDTTGLNPYVKDTFAYTGTYAFHTSWKEHQWDPINGYWAPMFYMSKTLNGLGRPDTVNIMGFDSLMNAWVPQTMDVVHYNSSNNPDTMKDYEYAFTYFPATPDFTTVYYYEDYTSTLSAQNTAPAQSATVYPNPAKHTVTVTNLNVAANAPVSIAVLNSGGQLVSRETSYWQGKADISVDHLAPGVYWLMIQDANGQLLHRQGIVKE